MAWPSTSLALNQHRPAVFPSGLRVVALGGSTGLPNVLRGLCALLYPGARRGHGLPCDQLVAIVTTIDDGGSSGRLRREFGIVPPGDIRNCLTALAEGQSVVFVLNLMAAEGPVGRIRHHPGRLATAISACADSSRRARAWLEQGNN